MYYQERALDGDRNKGDTGSTGRNIPSTFANPPSSRESQKALLSRSDTHHAIKNVQDMKARLASGYALMAAVSTSTIPPGPMP